MDFAPNWTQELVARTAREFAARELAPRAAARDRDETYPEAEMRALGELGLLGVCVPEEHGGAAAGPVALALAVAELARADASVAVTMSVTNMVAEVLVRHGNDELRRRCLPRLCSGDAIAGAFALSEPQSGSDAGAMATTAHPAPGGYRLRGAKQWITSGDRAGVIIVMARHPEAGKRRTSAFVVEPPVAGLQIGRHERKMGQRGSSTVPLQLEDLFVPEAARLGDEGDGLKVALTALDGGRIGVAAQAIGIGRAALDAAIAYARERRQFEQPIARFQAVQHMIADTATALEAAWLLTLRAAWLKERGLPFTRIAAEAKLLATERAQEACDRALQIHGGYGYTRDFPVERYLRDVRVTTIYEGTSQIQRVVIARQALRELEGTA
jgi:alkylation response protein AidB-like acyl-CoA dehydrogenase